MNLYQSRRGIDSDEIFPNLLHPLVYIDTFPGVYLRIINDYGYRFFWQGFKFV